VKQPTGFAHNSGVQRWVDAWSHSNNQK